LYRIDKQQLGWLREVEARARELGFAGLREYCETCPTESTVALGTKLRLRGIEFETALLYSAALSGDLRWYVRQALVRELHQIVVDSWGQTAKFDKARALTAALDPIDAVFDSYFDSHKDRVWTNISELAIPENWRPDDSTDPLFDKFLTGTSWSVP
jgi:hypothetical protein